MEITKISKENWEISYRKWKLIVEFAKQKIRFHTKYGFERLIVVSECGYCKEVNLNCSKCKLYTEGVCSSAEYAKRGKKNTKDIPYLRYIREMRRSFPKNGNNKKLLEINWADVLRDAMIMLNTIMKDEPI